MVLILGGSLVISLVAADPACGFCRDCFNAQSCQAKCLCPSLAQSFQQPSALIMKVNITRRQDFGTSVSFIAVVEKVFQGSTGRGGGLFELLPQQTTDPCYTEFSLDRYALSVPTKPLCQTSPSAPECFFLFVNQCDYFKLWKDLTPDELALLAKHNGTTNPLL